MIDKLLERKRAGLELGEGPEIPELSQYILEKMQTFEDVVKGTTFTKPWEPLDAYFRKMLEQTE